MSDIYKEEAKLLKETFKDNEKLLKAMRAVLLNLNPTKEEKDLVKSTFSNEALYKAIVRKFAPQMDKDVPIGKIQDMWLGIEDMIFGKSNEQIKQVQDMKTTVIEMVLVAVELLKNPDKEVGFVLDYTSENDERGVKLLARNQYIRHIEGHLMMLNQMANMPDGAVKSPLDSTK